MKRVLRVLALTLAMPSLACAASVTLEWDYTHHAQVPAVAFRLYKQPGCSGASQTVDIPATQASGTFSQTYTDDTITPNTQYCASMTAISADGRESTTSNVVQFQVQVNPATPSNLRTR